VENLSSIENSFRKAVCGELSLRAEGVDRFRVMNPFVYDDGDRLSIILRKKDGQWLLSDEASSFMHLSYEMEEKAIESGPRRRIISESLSYFGVENDDGELFVPVEQGDYGSALYSLVQGMLRVADVSLLSREVAKSTFMADLRTFLSEAIPEHRRVFNWAHPSHDPKNLYTVDCYVNGSTSPPIAIYGLASETKVRDATIALHRFESWDLRLFSIGIFDDFGQLKGKPLMRFLDILDKPYTSLVDNKDRIKRKLEAS